MRTWWNWGRGGRRRSGGGVEAGAGRGDIGKRMIEDGVEIGMMRGGSADEIARRTEMRREGEIVMGTGETDEIIDTMTEMMTAVISGDTGTTIATGGIKKGNTAEGATIVEITVETTVGTARMTAGDLTIVLRTGDATM